MGKREEKRSALKDSLIAAARARVEAGGLKDLSARTVTQDAGCALGSLYTVFDDLDDLIIHMNSKTLFELGEAIAAASEGVSGAVPTLKALALGYIHFASENYSLWLALFEYAGLSGIEIPEWHQNEQEVLVRHIIEPVKKLNPSMENEELLMRVRALFSAVHGIVSISLQDRFIGVPKDQLENEIIKFIDQMVAGLDD